MAQDSPSTLNDVSNFIRTITFAAVVAGVGYVGGWLYQNFYPDARIQDMDRQAKAAQAELQTTQVALQDAQQRVDRLATANKLLKVDRRVAELVCS